MNVLLQIALVATLWIDFNILDWVLYLFMHLFYWFLCYISLGSFNGYDVLFLCVFVCVILHIFQNLFVLII